MLFIDGLGPELLVNSQEAGNQTVSQRPGSVAMDDAGNFVVVWQDAEQIYAQRFNKQGITLGGEIDVSTQTSSLRDPVVAMDSAGNFAVAWASQTFVPTEDENVYAKSFNAAGNPFFAGELLVNNLTQGTQRYPSIAISDGGSFIVAFQSEGGPNDSGADVYVRRFNTTTGASLLTQIRANNNNAGDQGSPSVAADATGDFVVAWTGADASGTGIRSRVFQANGSALANEGVVNTFTAGSQAAPHVAIIPGTELNSLATARYLVTWSGQGADDAVASIYARRMGVGGDAAQFRVNVVTAGLQLQPSAAYDNQGNFVVSWTSELQDGNSFGVFARWFSDILGNDSADRAVNTYTLGAQLLSTVTMDADGDFVVAYAGEGLADLSPLGVYARRFSSPGDDDAPIVLKVFTQSDEIEEGSRLIEHVTQLRVGFSEGMADGLMGPNIISPALWRLQRTVDGVTSDITASINSITSGFNFETFMFEATLHLSTVLEPGFYNLTLWDTATDYFGVGLDGDVDGVAGGDFEHTFEIDPLLPQAGIKTYATNFPGFGAHIAAARNPYGTAMVWTEPGADDARAWIRYQRLDGQGNHAMPSVQTVNTIEISVSDDIDVVSDLFGNSVVVWTSGGFTANFGVWMRRYDSQGNPLGDPVKINGAPDRVDEVHAAMDASGNFVVTWSTVTFTPTFTRDVVARRFDSNGNPLGGQFSINTFTTGDQGVTDIAMDEVGNFVIVWESEGQDGDGMGVYARRYANNGALGSPFLVNQTTTGDQHSPSVGMDADGNFLISWTVGNAFSGPLTVWGRRFRGDGLALGSEFLVSNSGQIGALSRVAMDASGDAVVAWSFFQPVPAVFFQRYDGGGNAVGTVELVYQGPVINGLTSATMNKDGDLTLTWIESGIVSARYYSFNHTPQALIAGFEVFEGQGLFLDASPSLDPDGYPLAGYAWDLDNDGQFDDAFGQTVWVSWPDLEALGFGDGQRIISTTDFAVQVIDIHGATHRSDFFSLPLGLLYNSPPTAAIASNGGYRGENIEFTFSASDPSPQDQAANFTYRIDWDGNGTIDQTVVGPGSGMTLTRQFFASGNHTVKATATDKDGGQSVLSEKIVSVTDYVLRDDGTGKLDLIWGGTNGIDVVYFFMTSHSIVGIFTQYLNVPQNLTPVNHSASVTGVTGKVVIHAYGGDDVVVAELMQHRPVSILGGEGNDTLVGGFLSDTLDGGNGHDLIIGGTQVNDAGDLLIGGNGDDVLIGFAGSDTIMGGAGSDLLLADGILFSPAVGGLATASIYLSAEWSQSGHSYAERVGNLSGANPQPNRLNRNNALNIDYFLIPNSTLINDAAVDTLMGGTDLDWFVGNVGQDLATDPAGGEQFWDSLP
jgi:Ca2+-binding RTX toxin-like protein